MKVVVIGRHSGEIPGVEVVEQVSPQYPADSEGTIEVLSKLFNQIFDTHFRAAYESAEYDIEKITDVSTVIFQACPAQLAVALHKFINDDDRRKMIDRIGFIVSVPGERPASIEKSWNMTDGNMFTAVSQAAEIVKHCNPTAKVKIDDTGSEISVTVDRPMSFKFSHIEWLTE